jgi:hypothetical protein
MGSWTRSLARAAVATLLMAAALAQAGPRAVACPRCPAEPVFLDTECEGEKVGWILGNDRVAYFACQGWRDYVEVWAKRETPRRLAIKLSWTGRGGQLMVQRTTVALGEAVTIWSGGEQDVALYGGVAKPLTLTWAE